MWIQSYIVLYIYIYIYVHSFRASKWDLLYCSWSGYSSKRRFYLSHMYIYIYHNVSLIIISLYHIYIYSNHGLSILNPYGFSICSDSSASGLPRSPGSWTPALGSCGCGGQGWRMGRRICHLRCCRIYYEPLWNILMHI